MSERVSERVSEWVSGWVSGCGREIVSVSECLVVGSCN